MEELLEIENSFGLYEVSESLRVLSNEDIASKAKTFIGNKMTLKLTSAQQVLNMK